MRDDWSNTKLAPFSALLMAPLPAIDPAQIVPFNALQRETALREVDVAGTKMSFRLCPLPRIGPPPDWRIRVSLSDHVLILDCPTEAFALLFGQSVDIAACRAGELRMLLHVMCARIGGSLDRLVGDAEALDVMPYPADTSQHLTLGLEMTVYGQDDTVRIDVSGQFDLLLPLVEQSAAHSNPKLLSRVNVTCRAETRPFTATQSPLPAITPGDLIFLDATRPEGLFRLVAGGKAVADLTLMRGKGTVTALHDLSPKHQGDPEMAKDLASLTETQTGARATDGMDTCMSNQHDMTTEMSLEVGEWRMPFAALDALTQGTVLDIGAIDTNLVKIRLNGDVVATGALIDLGTGMGIQVRSLV